MWRTRQRKLEKRNIFSRVFAFLAGFDWIQIVALVFLIGIGLIFIRSTGIQAGAPYFFERQLQWIAGGVCGWLIVSLIDYRRTEYKVLAVLFYVATLGLLALVLVAGVEVYGSTRWLDIRPLGLRLQPSEFSKLALVFLLSAMFSSRMFSVNKFSCLFLGGLTVAVPFLLIVKEPDLGSAAILIPIFLSIVFCAGLKWRYILIAVVAAALLGGLAILNEIKQYHPFLKEYQRDRIRIFLNPDLDPLDRGYNQRQANLAVGSGGLTGKGIGEGTQNALGFLPQSVSNNDFIFSVIAEETGFLGCATLVFAYLLLFYSILRTAFLTEDAFGRYIAVGISSILFAHCFINMGMSIGLAPITGLSLPFVSYGGSFMLMGMAALGLMQSIYRHRREEET